MIHFGIAPFKLINGWMLAQEKGLFLNTKRADALSHSGPDFFNSVVLLLGLVLLSYSVTSVPIKRIVLP